MADIVFDTSAYLALIQGEEGAALVREHLEQAACSSVNYSELLSVLQRIGMPPAKAQYFAGELVRTIISFDEQQAVIADELYGKTKSFGLSLGDRACLALARHQQVPVLTADRVWGQLDLGIEVKMVR